MIYLIWSQDEFLSAEAVDKFTAKASEADEVITLDFAKGLPGLHQALFASSLFANKRFVVLRGMEAARKDDIERLSTALHTPDLGAEVVVVATSDYQPTGLTKSLQDVSELKKLARPRRGALVGWVAKKMKDAGLKHDNEAPGTLVEAVGESLRDLAHAVDQLAVRKGPGGFVMYSDVEAHFSKTAEQPIWVLFDAIQSHQGPKAFATLRRSLRAGDDPLAILFAIVSQVRYLIRTKSLLEGRPGVTEDDIARALSVSTGRAGVLRRQCGRLSWDWLLAVHKLLGEADFELKGGEDGAVLPSEIVLERVVAGALDAG